MGLLLHTSLASGSSLLDFSILGIKSWPLLSPNPGSATDDDDWELETASLVDTYNALGGCFEVVFVPIEPRAPIKEESFLERFVRFFSTMPWTAIPWDDSYSVEYLVSRFCISSLYVNDGPVSFVIDEKGFVSQQLDGTSELDYSTYGTPAYPFTDERFKSLADEDELTRKNPTITNLLASSGPGYVIDNNYNEVAVRDLEDKVVALYLYEDNDCPMYYSKGPIDHLTEKIKMAYQQLAGEKNFEIVLIYMHDTLDTFPQTNKDTFHEKFKTMPWLALPFKDPNIKKVMRFCGCTMPGSAPDHNLVIIGPRGAYVDPYGASILTRSGIIAYPFTRRKAAELDVEDYVKGLKLEKLWDRNSFFLGQEDWSHVRLTQFEGKRVILLIENDRVTNYTEFLNILKVKYLEVVGEDGEFEVIHINKNYASHDKTVATSFPWLTLPCFRDTPEVKFLSDAFYYLRNGLLAFDCDGRVVRRTIFPFIYTADFPFYTGRLEDEALRELIYWNEWDVDFVDKDSDLIVF